MVLWYWAPVIPPVPIGILAAQPEQTFAVTESCQQYATYYELNVPTTPTALITNLGKLWRQALIQDLSANYSISIGTDASVAAYTGSFNANAGYQLTQGSTSATSQILLRLIPGNQYYLLNNGPNGTSVPVSVFLCR